MQHPKPVTALVLALALTACAPPQVVPGALPAPSAATSLPVAAPQGPAATVPAEVLLRAVAYVPAGAVVAWRRAIGLSGDGLPQARDLQPLHVRWGDEPLASGMVRFDEPRREGPDWVMPLSLVGVTGDGRWVQVMSADERVLLAGRSGGQGETVSLTLSTTAAWLLREAMAKRGLASLSEPAPQVLAAMADRLQEAWQTGTGPAIRHGAVTQALTILVGAMAEGLPPDLQVARLYQTSGGGGGSGGAAGPPPLTVLPRLTGAAR